MILGRHLIQAHTLPHCDAQKSGNSPLRAPFHLKILKMRSSLKLLVFVAFFVSPFCYTQEKQKPTVFITTDDKPEDKKVYEGRGLFSQFSGAIYFVGNKNAGKRIEGSDDTESAFLPDGLK